MLAGTANDVTSTFLYNPASQIKERTRSNDRYTWGGYAPGTTGYTANGLNQYSAVGGGAVVHDANGNLSAEGGRGYAYDAENRLIAVSGLRTASLVYGPLGRLWRASGPSEDVRLVYDGDAMALEYAPGGTLLRRY